MARRPGGRPAISDEELLDEIRRLADELGAPPTAIQMDTHGKYSVRTYRNHFGRWNRAIKAAGFEPRTRH